jgi:hypothetical protein
MTILTIFLGIIVALLVLLGISYYLNKKSVSGLMDLKETIDSITTDKISKPGSSDYYYAVWVYVNTWDSSPKRLFSYDNQSLDLSSNSQELWFKYNCSNISTDVSNVLITSTFPIQKWTHVIISTVGGVLEFYLDGKLINTIAGEAPKVSTSATFINIGQRSTNIAHDTFISRMQRVPEGVDAKTAFNLYKKGPGTGLNMGSSKYDFSLKLTQNDKTIKTISASSIANIFK